MYVPTNNDLVSPKKKILHPALERIFKEKFHFVVGSRVIDNDTLL